jgi:hypothetical protein
MRRLVLIVALATIATSAMAQRGFPAAHFSPRPYGSFHAGYGGFARSGSFFYPLGDGLYADALDAGYPVASQPPVAILQAPSDRAAEARPAGEPVMIELQGDRYVRLSGPATNGAVTLDLQASTESPQARPVRQGSDVQDKVQQKVARQESVALIFRDGHREEVSDYVIANGVLYAHSNYYTSGAWTKNIDVATLDVPATVSYNQSQGVRFQLPNAGNEVIVGP